MDTFHTDEESPDKNDLSEDLIKPILIQISLPEAEPMSLSQKLEALRVAATNSDKNNQPGRDMFNIRKTEERQSVTLNYEEMLNYLSQ